MDARRDPVIFRLVVLFLGSVALAATVGGVLLASRTQEIPPALLTLGGTAIGALSGLLAALLGPKPAEPPERREEPKAPRLYDADSPA